VKGFCLVPLLPHLHDTTPPFEGHFVDAMGQKGRYQTMPTAFYSLLVVGLFYP
jgi:hypothetical protein